MRRILWLVSLVLLVSLVAAPGVWAQGQTVTVSMEDNFFDAADITVEPGTTVTWVQNGNNPHTTTSYDGLWDSGLLPGGSGQTFSFTFDEPGTYEYYCIPHESQGMVGTVTVTGGTAASGQYATTAAPLPTTGGPALSMPLLALALLAGGSLAVWVLRRRVS